MSDEELKKEFEKGCSELIDADIIPSAKKRLWNKLVKECENEIEKFRKAFEKNKEDLEKYKEKYNNAIENHDKRRARLYKAKMDYWIPSIRDYYVNSRLFLLNLFVEYAKKLNEKVADKDGKLKEKYDIKDIADEIEKKKYPEWPKRIQPKVIKLLLMFADRGPSLYDTFYHDTMTDSEAQLFCDVCYINELISKGLSYEEAAAKNLHFRKIIIGKASGLVVLDDKHENFFGILSEQTDKVVEGSMMQEEGKISFTIFNNDGEADRTVDGTIQKDGEVCFIINDVNSPSKPIILNSSKNDKVAFEPAIGLTGIDKEALRRKVAYIKGGRKWPGTMEALRKKRIPRQKKSQDKKKRGK